MMQRGTISFFFFITFFSFNVFSAGVNNGEVALMAYNVENLWDAVLDKEQGDNTYLPMAVKEQIGLRKACEGQSGAYMHECLTLDWTEEKYQKKLAAIARVVLDYNNGVGPDVLVLEELENEKVIRDLFNIHLRSHGFITYVHFESPSHRGIDVGIVSKLEVIRKEKHTVFDGTRDIVEAEVLVGGKYKLIIAANHWPSQGNPNSDRMKAATVLEDDIVKPAIARGVPVVAMGDFNTLPKENPNPIIGNIANGIGQSGDAWLVDFLPEARMNAFPPASHYYQRHWDPLDRIMATRDLLERTSPIQIDPQSFEIVAFEYQFIIDPKTGKKMPRRFDFQNATGFSDHLPLAVRVHLGEGKKLWSANVHRREPSSLLSRVDGSALRF